MRRNRDQREDKEWYNEYFNIDFLVVGFVIFFFFEFFYCCFDYVVMEDLGKWVEVEMV